MVKAMIDLKEAMMKQIWDSRCQIASLKKEKAEKKAVLWLEATGTVDQKKDYIRAAVADIDELISVCEADIELRYNQIGILDDKIELEYMSNDE